MHSSGEKKGAVTLTCVKCLVQPLPLHPVGQNINNQRENACHAGEWVEIDNARDTKKLDCPIVEKLVAQDTDPMSWAFVAFYNRCQTLFELTRLKAGIAPLSPHTLPTFFKVFKPKRIIIWNKKWKMDRREVLGYYHSPKTTDGCVNLESDQKRKQAWFTPLNKNCIGVDDVLQFNISLLVIIFEQLRDSHWLHLIIKGSQSWDTHVNKPVSFWSNFLQNWLNWNRFIKMGFSGLGPLIDFNSSETLACLMVFHLRCEILVISFLCRPSTLFLLLLDLKPKTSICEKVYIQVFIN